MSEHEGFKSSRLDSYNKLGVVVVWIQTGPLEAFVISHKWYRKFSVLLFSTEFQCPIYGPNVPGDGHLGSGWPSWKAIKLAYVISLSSKTVYLVTEKVLATRFGRYIAVTSGFKAKRLIFILIHPGLHHNPGARAEHPTLDHIFIIYITYVYMYIVSI